MFFLFLITDINRRYSGGCDDNYVVMHDLIHITEYVDGLLVLTCHFGFCSFPLFSAIYQICFEGRDVKEFITCLQNHPEHM